MSNRKTHVAWGSGAGMGLAVYMARDESPVHLAVETIGGGLGGGLGGAAPDVLEPAIHSWHRALAHSATTGAAGLLAIKEALSSWQKHCRREAARNARLASVAENGWDRFWYTMVELFWRLLSGFAAGLLAGYVSHIALDARTPRSIPLLGL